MATRFEIIFPLGTPDALEAAEGAFDLIDEVENLLTVYRDDSLTSLLNARAFREAVAVPPLLFDLLKQCESLARFTRGAFDPASGALTQAWGFHKREGRIPNSSERAEAMKCSGFRHIILDDRGRNVRYLREGLLLNFGSIGKGFALDLAANFLKERGISQAMLTAGGSSMLALGAPPDDPRGWPVAITHPANDGRSLAEIRLRNRAIATSAATFQRFEYNNKSYGHVIDPRSGHPAEMVASASAFATTASEADALATAFFVLDPAESAALLADRGDFGALILPAGDGVTPLRISVPDG
jgi:thiamine biosynthesis lipoprotein